MADQVASLNREPKHFQIGEPDAPCGGTSTCTDCVGAMIVRHERGQSVTAAAFRAKAAPAKDPCRGLNPSEALRGLRDFGIRGYEIVVNPTASEAIKATDEGVVLLAVGYDGFPTAAECEVGGKVDVAFRGPHAISLWGRRRWDKPPTAGATAAADRGRFKPGWRVWTRDPDHRFGDDSPPYDRFRSTYLVRAMDALIGNEGWQVRLMIAKDGRPTLPRAALRFAGKHTVEPTLELVPPTAEFPDFGSGQLGGPE